MDYPVSATGVSDGKPLLVLSPTPDIDDPDTMNQVVWSLMAIIESQSMDGVSFDPTNSATYVVLKNAIQAMINATTNALAAKLVPYGGVVWVPSRYAVSANFTPADGQIANRSDFPEITSRLGILPTVNDAAWIGTASNRGSYSRGDGSTTFRFPDYNGKYSTDKSLFLRGDGNNALDLGIIQDPTITDHYHLTGKIDGSGNFFPIGRNPPTTQGPFPRSFIEGQNSSNTYNNSQLWGNDPNTSATTDQFVDGSTENRPKNVAGVWCIRTDGVPYVPPPP